MTISTEASTGLNWITLIAGPFIGASLAFMSSRLLDGMRRHRENVAAANLALLTIKSQYNDFLLFRRGFREDIVREGLKGDEPLWVLVRPSFLTFGNYEFDFKSIGFLFEQPGNAEVFEYIEQVQICHRDLVALEKLRTENAITLQSTASKFQKGNPNPTWTGLEAEVGRALTELLKTTAIGLAKRANENEEVYLKAFSSLRCALNRELNKYWLAKVKGRFGLSKRSAGVTLINVKTPKPSFELAALPPMPIALAKAVAEINTGRSS